MRGQRAGHRLPDSWCKSCKQLSVRGAMRGNEAQNLSACPPCQPTALHVVQNSSHHGSLVHSRGGAGAPAPRAAGPACRAPSADTQPPAASPASSSVCGVQARQGAGAGRGHLRLGQQVHEGAQLVQADGAVVVGVQQVDHARRVVRAHRHPQRAQRPALRAQAACLFCSSRTAPPEYGRTVGERLQAPAALHCRHSHASSQSAIDLAPVHYIPQRNACNTSLNVARMITPKVEQQDGVLFIGLLLASQVAAPQPLNLLRQSRGLPRWACRSPAPQGRRCRRRPRPAS